jgi:hypothetical protein
MTDLQSFLDGVERTANGERRAVFFDAWGDWKARVLAPRDTHPNTPDVEAEHDEGGAFDNNADQAAGRLQPGRWKELGGWTALEAWWEDVQASVEAAFGAPGTQKDKPQDLSIRPASIEVPPFVPTDSELNALRGARGDVQTPKEYAAEVMQMVGGIARRHARFIEHPGG